MIRQSKKDSCYTVEVLGGPSEPEVYATNPRDAVVFTLKKHGYYVKRDNVVAANDNKFAVVKVCLLGGTRESVNYYTINGIKF